MNRPMAIFIPGNSIIEPDNSFFHPDNLFWMIAKLIIGIDNLIFDPNFFIFHREKMILTIGKIILMIEKSILLIEKLIFMIEKLIIVIEKMILRLPNLFWQPILFFFGHQSLYTANHYRFTFVILYHPENPIRSSGLIDRLPAAAGAPFVKGSAGCRSSRRENSGKADSRIKRSTMRRKLP